MSFIKMKHRKTVAIATVLAALSALCAAFLVLVPPSLVNREKIVFGVSNGMSLGQVAEKLDRESIVRSETAFALFAKISGEEKNILAGDFEISRTMNVPAVLKALTGGKAMKSCFTVPEGFTIDMIAALVEKKGFGNAERFSLAARDPAFAASLDIRADSFEGYLFPETYCASKGSNEKDIIALMIKEYRKVFDKNAAARAQSLGLSEHSVVILASIIEKETSSPRDMRLVSSVFHNRLKSGMPLQSCPTVIYALGDNYDGNLTAEDLQTNSPYNTYARNGLPPGPICNPGEAALSAAVYPAESEYLYFVSSGSGRTIFSSSLAEHNRAVAEHLADRAR